ncbi:MAG: GTP-binding protein [Chloroflexi bacterium]|nr:GTP-binding protein [Chloroflexota bacterium]
MVEFDPTQQRYPTYKVLLAGNGSVGKSSLLNRIMTGEFERARNLTVGVDLYTQVVDLNGRAVKLSIWDIAGQQRFAFFRRSFYRGARAAALVFDVSDADTLHSLTLWRDEVYSIAPKAKVLIVGNKVDLPRQVSYWEAKAWATALGFPYLETSAVTGQNVERVFEGLGWLSSSG